MTADVDLVVAEPEGEGLYGERLVHARGEIDRPYAYLGVPGVLPGDAQHEPNPTFRTAHS